MRYIRRHLEKSVIEANKTFKVIFLGGPRQIGKTTLLKHLSESLNLNYVTLDDINLRELAKSDPELFLQQFESPLIIDEVQYAPELFPYIKKIVDSSDKNGQYWLTGSQQFSLIRHLQESLAGRVAILSLLGLSQGEKIGVDNKIPFMPELYKDRNVKREVSTRRLFKSIFLGGFPVFQHKDKPDRDVYFNSYLQTYIDRDLVDIFGITKVTEFNRFMQACAARTAQILNISDLARDSGVSVHAAKEWLGILESSNQIFLLKPYFSNFTKRIIKAPKLYFLDTGLAGYLTRWDSAKNLRFGAMSGAIYETYVVSEVIKSYLFRGKQPPVYYFRDKEGHEVDLVIEQVQDLHLLEIKLSAKVNHDHTTTLNYLSERVSKVKTKSVISLIDKPMVLPNEVVYLPYTYIN